MFFTASLSKDNRILSYHMKYSIRVTLAFILLSLAGMFIFSFTLEDFNSASMPGKINIIFLPVLVIIGSLYINTIIINKNIQEITIKKGFAPFVKKEKYNFKDLEAVIYNPIGDPNKDNSFFNFSFRKYMFGFKLKNGSYVILERAANEKTATAFYAAFRAFFPYKIGTIK